MDKDMITRAIERESDSTARPVYDILADIARINADMDRQMADIERLLTDD